MLAEHDIDQRAITVDRAIKVLPITVYPDIRLVDIPATANFALSASPKFLCQSGRQFRFPIADRLVGEYDATDQEHLGEISQTEFGAEPPEHHESNHVARILRPVSASRCSVR